MLSANISHRATAATPLQSLTSEQASAKQDISTCTHNPQPLIPLSRAATHSQFSMNSPPQCDERLATIENTKQIQSLMTAAPLAVGHPREKSFPWAEANNLYLPQQELVNNILNTQSTQPKILVIDVRDEDAIGGQISGAFHTSDKSLAQPEVLADLAGKALELGPQGTVVFHCMESLRRGPRCAQRLSKIFNLVDENQEKPLQRPSIRVLEGGADRWIRAFWNTPLVEHYDDEYWGLADMTHDHPDPLITEHCHALYTIPQDELHPKAKL